MVGNVVVGNVVSGAVDRGRLVVEVCTEAVGLSGANAGSGVTVVVAEGSVAAGAVDGLVGEGADGAVVATEANDPATNVVLGAVSPNDGEGTSVADESRAAGAAAIGVATEVTGTGRRAEKGTVEVGVIAPVSIWRVASAPPGPRVAITRRAAVAMAARAIAPSRRLT